MSIVTRLWQKQPGDFFFVSYKGPGVEWKDKAFHRDELSEVDEFVRDLADKKMNVYFCPHGFSRPRRLEKYAAIPKLLWADLDHVDPRKLNGTQPNIAWETSEGRFAGMWLIDRPMTKELNRDLTYTIGADKGGWDITQVLRWPGLVNYKYPGGSPGKLLYQRTKDSDVIKVRDLKQHLKIIDKPASSISANGVPESDAASVYKKYHKKLSAKTRTMILAKKAVGDRSGVLWQLGFALIEAGLTRDEWITLVASTVWNKFANRPHQLEREYEKILATKLPAAAAFPLSDDEEHTDENNSFASRIKALSEVEEKDIDWVVPGWFPSKMITIIEGDPGIGKSWLTQFLCLKVVSGKRFKTHNQYALPPRKPASVLYIDLENDVEAVTKRRLRWMGLQDEDAHRFLVYDSGFSLSDPDTVDQIREFLQARIDAGEPVRVLAFDTFAAYLGETDAHNSKEVAQMMAIVADLAREFNLAVVLLRHLRKGKDSTPITAGQGSMSFAGMARMIHRVAKHPREEDQLVVKTIKSGISRTEPAVCFQLLEGERLKGEVEAPTFVDIIGFDFEIRDDELGTAPKKEDKVDTLTEAKLWLQKQLAGGPVFKEALLSEMAKRNKNFSERTLDRAAKELQIKMKRNGRGMQWILKNADD